MKLLVQGMSCVWQWRPGLIKFGGEEVEKNWLGEEVATLFSDRQLQISDEGHYGCSEFQLSPPNPRMRDFQPLILYS